MRGILMPHWSLLPVLRIWPEEADNRQRGDWDHKGESPALIHLLRCAVVADHSITTGFPSLPTRRLAKSSVMTHEKDSRSMEKDEVDYFEQGVHENTYAPKTRVEVYEVLLSYQEHNAGRLVLDPRLV